MLGGLMEKKEKKVEYIELIYDLIFVYIIGRNNSLLHHISGGVIRPASLLTYGLATLTVLQIWYYTTLYVNRYGENGPKLYVGIFVNMFLLYFMSLGIRADWQDHYVLFAVSWALVLINLACLYISEYRATDQENEEERRQIRFSLITLFCEAALVLLSVPLYLLTGLPLGPLAMVFGMVTVVVGARRDARIPIDFAHLSERVMLYVVFTFGEMVIVIAGYFEGGLNFNTVYFAVFAFLIVVGLFSSYGMMYDKIINKEFSAGGTAYMLLHIFLILALNNITAAMEFMREDEVDPLFKTLFLTLSFAFYYIFLFFIGVIFSKSALIPDRRYTLESVFSLILYIALMVVFYQNAYVSIALTALYAASVFVLLFLYRRRRNITCL